MNKKPFCQGEAFLGAWSRQVVSSSGVTDAFIKLYITDEAIIDAMARLPDGDIRGKKKDGGKHFFIQIFEVDENGECVPEEQHESEQQQPEPHQEKTACEKAGIICKDPYFGKFAERVFQDGIRLLHIAGEWKGTDEEKAAKLVRFMCSVESRRDLDIDFNAKEIFFTMFWFPFIEYKKQLGVLQ